MYTINPPIKAYSYLRFSTTRQIRGDSARRQLELARNYAESKGLELQEQTLADMGVSAFKGANREAALGYFLELVKAGTIPKGSYLLVESHDRLSRQSVERALAQFLEIINAGIVVVTLADELEYRQGQLDMHKLMISLVYMSRANEESEMKSRRGAAVWEQNRKAAIEHGRVITNAYLPQWLRWEDDKVVPIAERVAVIQQMFSMALCGYGHARIAAALNKQGTLSFRKNKPWRPAGIAAILKSRRVIGEYQNHKITEAGRVPVGEPIADYFPAIISLADFMEVQQQIANRNRHSGAARKGRFDNIFSGILRCQCGESMRFHNKGKAGKSRYYLVCPMKEASSCDMPMLRYDAFEPQALVAISHLHPVMDRRHRGNTQLAELDNEIAKLADKVAHQEQRKRRALTLALDGDDPMLADALKEACDELKFLQSQLAEHTDLKEKLLTATRTVHLLKPQQLSTSEKRQIFNSQLHLSLEKIQLTYNGEDIVVCYYPKASNTPLLEQTFKNKLSISTARDIDGHVCCKTISQAPYVDDSWFDNFSSHSAESGYDVIDGDDIFCWDSPEGK